MNNKKRYISITVLVIAFAMMAYGIFTGEMSIVLSKAINICLECIGLGS